MNEHCELCKTEMLYWAGFRKKGFIVGEKFYCEKCAIKACETAKEKDAEIERMKQRSVTELCADHLNLHEYVKQMDAGIARLRETLANIMLNADTYDSRHGTKRDAEWCAEQARRAMEEK